VTLLAHLILEMHGDADTKDEEMDQGDAENLLSPLVNVGNVPFIGQLIVAQSVPEHVLR
jgi:hypothetical protein